MRLSICSTSTPVLLLLALLLVASLHAPTAAHAGGHGRRRRNHHHHHNRRRRKQQRQHRGPVSRNNYWAARCVADAARCTYRAARLSYACRPRAWPSTQSQRCRKAACNYCTKNRRRRRSDVCQAAPIQRFCFGRRPRPQPQPKPQPKRPMRPKPRPQPKPQPKRPMKPTKPMPKPMPKPKPPASNGQCISRGRNGRVNIPALRFPTKWPWARRRDYIEWKPTGEPWIDPRGSGRACVRFSVDVAARYYLTLRSAGKMKGEHNDVWVWVTGGLSFWRAERRSFVTGHPTKEVKAYHAAGNHRIFEEVYSKDHNPHQLLTVRLVPGRVYDVCLSGRSSLFRVYNVKLLACNSGIQACAAWRPKVREAIRNMPVSKCY